MIKSPESKANELAFLLDEQLESLFTKPIKKQSWNNQSPIKYVGGKTYMTEWLRKFIPTHQTYIEVFGGGGSLLFAKEKSKLEVYNDLDDSLTNFFRILREKPRDLFKSLFFMPYSRKEFDLMKEKYRTKEYTSELEKAIVYFYMNKACFSGFMANPNFAYDIQHNRHNSAYRNHIQRIFSYWNRIKDITIENLDFRELIPKYDTETSFFYCDPPYFDLKFYAFPFNEKDHSELAGLLKDMKGKFMFSINYHPILEKLYPKEKFYWDLKKFRNVAPRIIRKERVELLIMNYNSEKTQRFNSKSQIDLNKWLGET